MSLFVSLDGGGFKLYGSKIRPVPVASSLREIRSNSEAAPETRPPARRNKAAAYERALDGRNRQKRHVLLVRDIMTSHPVTIAPDQTLSDVQAVLTEERFRHLPAVDADGQLIGIVSDRDVLRHSSNPDASTSQLLVRDIITPRAFAASIDATIAEIAQLMLAERVGSLPILSASGALVGIVTTTDILKGLISRVPIELWV